MGAHVLMEVIMLHKLGLYHEVYTFTHCYMVSENISNTMKGSFTSK